MTGCNPSEPPYEIRPIRQINPNLSSGLEKLLKSAPNATRMIRYQSCAELMIPEHYEEIDDEYKKAKKKMGVFLVSSSLDTVICSNGFYRGHMAKN